MRKLIGFVTLVAVAFAANQAQAFCIYNKTTNKDFWVMQRAPALSGMNKTIRPGGKECCAWDNLGCNPGQNRGTALKILMEYDQGKSRVGCGRMESLPPGMDGYHEVEILSDGYVTIENTSQPGKRYRVVSWTKDHKDHQITWCPGD